MFIEKTSLLKKGKPKTLIYGVGINDAKYLVGYKDSNGKSLSCPYYDRWRGMLGRCYSRSFHKRQPSYLGCTVEESWKTFSNFKLWMQSQDWEGKALDKDLLCWGNKHYGPEYCLFVSQEVNSLLALRGNHRGAYPLGVIRTGGDKYEYYEAKCSFYGKQTRLGTYKTPAEAAEVYKQAKLRHIAEVAQNEKDPRVKAALLALF